MYFYIALPIAVFLDLSTADKGYLSKYPKFIIVNILIGVIVYLLLFFALRWIKLPRKNRGSVLYGAVSGNNIFFGLPILLSIYGQDHFTLGVIYSVFSISFLDAFGFILLNKEKNSEAKSTIKKEIKEFIKNPIVIGTLLGLAALLTGINTDKVSEGVTQSLSLIAKTTSGMALVTLGLYFAYNFKITKVRLSLVTTLLKLVVFPLFTYLVVFYIFPLELALAQVSVVQAAMPVAVSSLVVAEIYDLDKEQSASTIIISSVIFLLTLPIIFLLPNL